MKGETDLDKFEGSSLVSDAGLIVRYVVTAIGGYLVGNGIMDQSTLDAIAGVTVTMTPVLIGMAISHIRMRRLRMAAQELRLSRELAKEQGRSKGTP